MDLPQSSQLELPVRSAKLTKSRFIAGVQCHRLLWWTVYEPEARELQPDVVLRDLFDQSHDVEVRARQEWPAGADVEFQVPLEAEGVHCRVDVLEKNEGTGERGEGWTLIEVKATNELKDYHIPDVAVQVYVARKAGVHVTRAEVMHLNREYRHPRAEPPLFVREDVTGLVEKLMPDIPRQIAEQREALKWDLPPLKLGPHCWWRGADKPCAFWDRCWPTDGDHIGNLWNVGPKTMWSYMQQGVHRMSQLPPDAKLHAKQQRQLKAQREERLIVEPGLAEALRPALEVERLGFLDFETVSRALPVWDECKPYQQIAAQFSYHERARGERGEGEVTHVGWLAEGPEHPRDPPDDPREPLARAMIEATKDAQLVVMYTSFEKTRIQELAAHLPFLSKPLLELRDKLWDLNPVVANHVYHPDFRGSFSLKEILHPLVPDLSYDDLIIVDGKVASVEIARLLFVSGRIPKAQRAKTRADLLAYCERDTFATVRLVEELARLAGH